MCVTHFSYNITHKKTKMNAHKTDSIEIYIFYMTRARVECIYLFSCIFCVYFINSQHRVCLCVCV